MEFGVIVSMCKGEFERLVLDKLEAGWELAGDLVMREKHVRHNVWKTEYAQPMILYDMKVSKYVREALAGYAHCAWSGWMKYMFEKSTMSVDGTYTIPLDLCERWMRQMRTEYKDLPGEERASDRAEADKILKLL